MTQRTKIIGKTVGSYRVLESLGEGGMGEVFLAEHPVIRSRVAIKVLHSRYLSDAGVVKRFIDEARAVNTISHPGIVRIHDCRRLDDVGVYLVMELLEGESLLDKLRREGRQTPRFVARLMQQIASALVTAHKAGIIHRDLKPANIFLVNDEDLPSGIRAKVLDFGVAKLKVDPAMAEGSTMTGAVFGSPRYMSPEQCLDTKNVDERSDIYSLGAMAYELLTERAPYEADTLGKLVLAHQMGSIPPLDQVNNTVPPALAELIMSALVCDPKDRLPNMRTLRNTVAALRWVDDHHLTDVPASEESQATWEFDLPDEDFEDEEDEPARDVITSPPTAGPAKDDRERAPEEEAEPEADRPPREKKRASLRPPTDDEPGPRLMPLTSSDNIATSGNPTGEEGEGGAPDGARVVFQRKLRGNQQPTLLILALMAMLVGGGRLVGTALDKAMPVHVESSRSPTLRGCMGVQAGAAAQEAKKKAAAAKKTDKKEGARKKSTLKSPKRGSAGKKLLPPGSTADNKEDTQEGGECYASSELILLGLARFVPGGITPASLALARALFMLLVASLLTMALARFSSVAALINAILFAAVVTDPATLLWLGSLHLEFSHTLYLYAVLVLAVIVTQYSDKFVWHASLGLALGLVGLVHSHHRFLPLLLGFFIFLQLAGIRGRKAGRALAIYMACALTVLVLQTLALDQDGPVKQQAQAGLTGVVLGTVLDAFEDREAGTKRLGLSPSCAMNAGLDGHTLDPNKEHPCPDVLHMSRGKVAGTLLSNPSVAWRIVGRGLSRVRPWVTGKAKVSGAEVKTWGLSATLEALPQSVFVGLLVLLLVGMLATMGRLLLSLLMGADPMGGPGVVILLSTLAGAEVFIASLFSEGYIDLDRHTHVMATVTLTCLGLGLVALVHEIMVRLKPGQ